MIGIALVLLLAQPSPDDPPAASATIDTAAKTIPGWRGGGAPIGDAAFLERVMSDLVNAAPTDAELKAFVGDPDPRKRSKRINQLLDDARFAPFWADRFAAVFFGDLDKVRLQGLGPLAEGVEASIVPSFRKWLTSMVRKDKPWTEIVTSILDARGSTEGDPVLAYKLALYRDPGMEKVFAESVARHFLAVRVTCARCHDHPFDKWRMEDYYGLAAFASGQRADRVNGIPQVRYADGGTLEMVPLKDLRPDATVRSASGTAAPQFLFGGKPERVDDYMKSLANSMTHRANTQLPRALANRVWGWLMGWGVVHPVDDFNLRNKPLSPVLLDALTRALIDNGYSLKPLIRAICNTQEYQFPTPDQAPDLNTFRALATLKFGLGPYEDASLQRPAPPFFVPEPWQRVRPKTGGLTRWTYRQPDPKDKSRNAELRIFDGKDQPETNLRQFEKPKVAKSDLQGKAKIALTEVTGITHCRPGSEGPLDVTAVSARIEPASGGAMTLRLEGPTDLVAALRDEFLGLIRSLGGK